jgi:TetR/AcrR family transcriptional repressor of nem operon
MTAPQPTAPSFPPEAAQAVAAADAELDAALLGSAPRGAADTRERILDLAQDIVQRRSFNSFSYQDLADGVGIRKASIHYHFPAKEDLGAALVERISHALRRWANRLSAAGVPPELELAAFLGNQRRLLDQGEKICVYGVLGAEYNALPPRVQAAYGDLLEGQQRWLSRVLGGGRERGVFAFQSSPEEEALIVASAVQGALQIARASHRVERFDAVVAALIARLRGPQAQQLTERPVTG